jgi:hypothetical protein
MVHYLKNFVSVSELAYLSLTPDESFLSFGGKKGGGLLESP